MTRRTSFEQLPGELIADIATRLTLSSLISLSQTNPAIRSICAELQPCKTVVQRLVDDWQGSTEADRMALATLSRRPELSATAVFAYVLKHGYRGFILDWLEVPSLRDQDWRDIFTYRFCTETVERAKTVNLPWRAKYGRELRHLEHVYQTGCSRTQNKVTYFTLYRHDRLTINRISSMQMNHQAVFSSMKAQANLSNYPTRMTAFRARPDIRFMVLYCSGDKPLDHYQANVLATDLIGAIEKNGSNVIRRGLPESHIVLGPSLILCTIAPGTLSISADEEHVAYHDVSFEALAALYPPLRNILPNGPERFMGYV